ncbi:MAG: hypothetical protein Q9168_008115 [Polycauliona sp. 1 TL-2023]
MCKSYYKEYADCECRQQDRPVEICDDFLENRYTLEHLEDITNTFSCGREPTQCPKYKQQRKKRVRGSCSSCQAYEHDQLFPGEDLDIQSDVDDLSEMQQLRSIQGPVIVDGSLEAISQPVAVPRASQDGAAAGPTYFYYPEAGPTFPYYPELEFSRWAAVFGLQPNDPPRYTLPQYTTVISAGRIIDEYSRYYRLRRRSAQMEQPDQSRFPLRGLGWVFAIQHEISRIPSDLDDRGLDFELTMPLQTQAGREFEQRIADETGALMLDFGSRRQNRVQPEEAG